VFDLLNTPSISRVTSLSHSLTGMCLFRSGSGVARRNHGRAGLVMPDIIPAASTRTARVPVLS